MPATAGAPTPPDRSAPPDRAPRPVPRRRLGTCPTRPSATPIDRALDAYVVLEELGEQIEDEWSYVADLTDAWRTRLDEVAAHRGDADLSDEASAAVDHRHRRDRPDRGPHRAIDWLSTFPQVVLLSLGERP